MIGQDAISSQLRSELISKLKDRRDFGKQGELDLLDFDHFFILKR